MGCDFLLQLAYTFHLHFYSHIPCGMWLSSTVHCSFMLSFLLTHPVWDVTYTNSKRLLTRCISTHTSRVGCDKAPDSITFIQYHFYSHIPCGMWQDRRGNKRAWNYFYSHIPCGMWPTLARALVAMINISTHTSRVGCDVARFEYVVTFGNFYSHIPCGMWLLIFPERIKGMNFYSHIPCGMWRRYVLRRRRL